MLKKKKTTASGKLVLVKSVRRHWTSGGCPLSADRSGTETAQPQNEILCSKGLGGRCPGQASGEENHGGIFFSAGLCVLTQALLASFRFKFFGQLCQFFHRFLGVMQQGVTHFWWTAGIKHFHLIDTLILQRNIWIYKRI